MSTTDTVVARYKSQNHKKNPENPKSVSNKILEAQEKLPEGTQKRHAMHTVVNPKDC